MAGFVFDALVVTDSSFTQIALLARPEGPIEDGYFDVAGNWIVNARPTLAEPGGDQIPGFGVDGSGRPYYDSAGVTGGDGASLWVNGSDGAVWLEDRR